jgi:hypothetical protein
VSAARRSVDKRGWKATDFAVNIGTCVIWF